MKIIILTASTYSIEEDSYLLFNSLYSFLIKKLDKQFKYRLFFSESPFNCAVDMLGVPYVVVHGLKEYKHNPKVRPLVSVSTGCIGATGHIGIAGKISSDFHKSDFLIFKTYYDIINIHINITGDYVVFTTTTENHIIKNFYLTKDDCKVFVRQYKFQNLIECK